MGGHPERVRLAGEERGDQKDDGGGRCGYPDAGGLRRAGGYWKAEGTSTLNSPWGLGRSSQVLSDL